MIDAEIGQVRFRWGEGAQEPHTPGCGPCANEKVQAANRANAARSTGPRTRAGKQRSARNALRHGLNQPVLADPGLAAEAADLARRIAGEHATEPRHAAAFRIAEAQVDLQRIRRVREQIMVEGFAAAGDITARLMRLDRYERRALSRRKSAIRAFDSLEHPAPPPRRRNPWAAVAAAAKLRGLWRNEPGFGGTRDPWAAVAAAARLRGSWQNKPDFGRARLQRAAAAGRRAVRQNGPDVAGAPARMCASPDRASSTIVRPDVFPSAVQVCRNGVAPACRQGQSPATSPKQERTPMSMWNKTALAAIVCAMLPAIGPAAAQTPSPAGAQVYVINLKNGDTVASPFKVQFGLTGMGVAPAGVEKPNTGHHHLIIDAKLTADELKAPIASDAKHMHFGAGQTEAMVTLPPGQHTLQLVLGDWSHIPLVPPVMSEPVTVTVK